ncbi:archease [Methanocalculus taiwanensis]|uniref:Archease n=1 Tax=Methanocalculus taiwanensis TaxID=106207 RepID=A0ABD4TIQ8_9EURY|nr:archease [Methanocalculus taiwanensis]MCQ1537648.1 archease [Methanocalculus taiwanensis]
MVNQMGIEELEHTADVRIRIRAESHEELFTLASSALFSILYTGDCRIERERELKVSGDNIEDLLWDFLSELLYISEVESFVVCETSVCFIGNDLYATIRGETFHPERHGGGREVKGISYSDLFIREMDSMICSEIIFDI